jgi:hypothetical protein
MNTLHRILAAIASKHLDITTLQQRYRDSLDFHDVAVWQVEAALKAAFTAGAESAAGKTARQGTSPARLAEPATPLLIPRGRGLVPGKMYLRLYHGRTDPDQEMDDWGFVGPTFGPLSCYVHTYCCTFRIHGEGPSSEVWLEKHDDMIRWGGCFYGDMEVFLAGANDRA